MRFLIYNSNGERVNTIVANESFVKNYCEIGGYTYESVKDPEPRPMPEPVVEEPTTEEILYAMLGVSRYE